MDSARQLPSGWGTAVKFFLSLTPQQLAEYSLPEQKDARKIQLRYIFTDGKKFLYSRGGYPPVFDPSKTFDTWQKARQHGSSKYQRWKKRVKTAVETPTAVAGQKRAHPASKGPGDENTDTKKQHPSRRPLTPPAELGQQQPGRHAGSAEQYPLAMQSQQLQAPPLSSYSNFSLPALPGPGRYQGYDATRAAAAQGMPQHRMPAGHCGWSGESPTAPWPAAGPSAAAVPPPPPFPPPSWGRSAASTAPPPPSPPFPHPSWGRSAASTAPPPPPFPPPPWGRSAALKAPPPGYSAASCGMHRRAPTAGMLQPTVVAPSTTQSWQLGHQIGRQPGSARQKIPQATQLFHTSQPEVMDGVPGVDDKEQGGFPCVHESSAAGVGDVKAAAGTPASAVQGHQTLGAAGDAGSMHICGQISPIRMSEPPLQPQRQKQQLAEQPGGQQDSVPIRSWQTTQHQQQSASAVHRVQETLTQQGYHHVATATIGNPVPRQQAAGTGTQYEPTKPPAAAAARATHSPTLKREPVKQATYWDAVFSAAAAAIVAAAGATGMAPSTAAMMWLRQAVGLALRLLNQQCTHPPAAPLADDVGMKDGHQQQEVDPAVHALRAAFKARTESVGTFTLLIHRVVLCEIENSELAGKQVVLLGARAQGASAQVHVGLAAAPQQLAAGVPVLVSFLNSTGAAIDSVISSATDISGAEQRLLQCADNLAAAAQKVVEALPNAVLVAVKVFRAEGDWQSAREREYEVLKVLCQDAECRPLVTELLGSGYVAGPVWTEEQHHNSSDMAAAASTAQGRVIIMRCLPQTLDEMLQTTGPVSEQQAKQIMRRLFQLLRRCHSGLLRDGAGNAVTIAHRDLKAANVLLDADGNSKVGDWGAATMLYVPAGTQADTAVCDGLFAPLAQMHTQIGTPLFMPGDVAIVTDAGYDSSVDCHGAALVGVEMMAGGWNKVLPSLATVACMARGGLAANYPLYLQQLKQLAAGQVKFPREQQVSVGLGSFRDLLARACGLGCQRHAASFLLQHPWLVSD